MNILILGSGGREHTLAWKTAQSPLCKKLFIAPGNAGTAECGENVDIAVDDFEAIAAFCRKNSVYLIVVGPEGPLVKGIVDYFRERPLLHDIKLIGPDKKGAALEGSKDFAKAFMKKYDIPTAAYNTFTRDTFDEGVQFLKSLKAPYVLKADGLAAGKGVLISESLEEATQNLKTLLLDKAFGQASEKVVIEAFLKGIELSVFVATDGKNWQLLPSAKDYKRIGEGDTGLNTGGMGAVSPVPFADQKFMEKVKTRIVEPTIKGLQQENIDYKGFIFIGLMNVDGDPYVIEYNVRLGDPETEVIIPRIQSDLVQLFAHISQTSLHEYDLVICPEFAVTVMLVSGGYPEDYKKGYVIDKLDEVVGSRVFFAGARWQEGKVLTSGGRVLAVTSVDASMDAAVESSLRNARLIDYTDKYFRSDIAQDLK